MPASVLEIIPPAVLAGLALGGVFTVVATAIFAVGERVFPTQARVAEAGSTYSSEGRRRGEIRQYLQDIGERYAEEYPLEGTDDSVAFYLPERDVAVTFDAHQFFRLQNVTGTHVILVEHEMPGVHLGERLPFEVPELEGEPPVTDRRRRLEWAHDALGVSPTADLEEVRSAYRERVKQAHPDHGGSKAAFREVQDAYATVREHAE